ncbi:MAG: amidohydrolase, partial [Limisphaerales bacterium]
MKQWFPVLSGLLLSAGTLLSAVAPDIVIVNATVRTMDEKQPRAEAIAISGNKIAAIGTTAQIRQLAGPATRVVDAQKRLVLPGFNDSHVHFMDGGFSLSNVDLRDAKTPEEFAKRIGDFARKLPKGRWIIEGGWDHEKWPGTPLPTKEMIDAVTPDHPVFVSRTDGHMALANSLAIKLAGVSREMKDPPGGSIVRDQKGEPTGVFKDAAMDPFWKVIPAKSFEEKVEAARAGSEYAASLGVTSVQDMSAGADVGVYQHLLERGELKTRIYAVRSIMSWEVLKNAGVRAAFGNDMLRIGGLKGFADGSLGSTTALFFEPYHDEPNNRGLLGDQMQPEGIMLKRTIGADQSGLQVMIHAIGDEANKQILDLFKQAAELNGEKDRRFRIEHAQHLRTNEIVRFGPQKVIPSMQPFHAIDDGRWCDRRIGHERSRGTYPFRSLLDAGAMLAFGTDWTVAPLDPMISIYAAVTRRTLDGKHPNGWVPEEKITVEEAVRCYTVNSAYAEFAENVKGTITPGKLADLVMLDKNIFEIDPVEIENTKVLLTL